MGIKKEMTKRQIEIINGALLGDAYAEKRRGKTRIRFRYAVGYKEYISYLFKEMGGLTTGKLSEH